MSTRTYLFLSQLTTIAPHNVETSQLICSANQLTGFYMMGNIHGFYANFSASSFCGSCNCNSCGNKKGPKPQFLHITVTLSNAGYLEFVSLFCWNGATAATIFHSLRYFHCEQGKAEAASSLQFNKKETLAKETLAQVSSSEFC